MGKQERFDEDINWRVFALAATFTVMCYNVLCDKYATRQLYGYCPSWALNWEYRKKGIMEEITNCDADIISLQVRLQRRLSSGAFNSATRLGSEALRLNHSNNSWQQSELEARVVS